jgi:hypothetical protein
MESPRARNHVNSVFASPAGVSSSGSPGIAIATDEASARVPRTSGTMVVVSTRPWQDAAQQTIAPAQIALRRPNITILFVSQR